MGSACRYISIRADDGPFPACFCLPPADGVFPAIIVLHGSDGFKSNHADFAASLGREGFAALVPTWFGGDSPRRHWDEIRASDLQRITAWLKKHPGVDPTRIGCLGFSRGGGLALISGALVPEISAIVNYFGLTAWEDGLKEFAHLPLNRDDPFDFVEKIGCPILTFHGEQDDVVPVENSYRLDDACRHFGVEHRFHIFPGVNHSFVWPGDKFNQRAQIESWQKTLAFLKSRFKDP